MKPVTWGEDKDHFRVQNPCSWDQGAPGLIHPVLELELLPRWQCLWPEEPGRSLGSCSQPALIYQSRTVRVGWGDLVLVKQKDIPRLGQGHLSPRVLVQNH